MADLPALIARYAAVFHDVVGGGGHHVASPLGAWLLLGLAAPAASGADSDELVGVLGTGGGAAAALAAELLARPHPLVASAAAVWNRPGTVDQDWLDGLPAEVERGDIPTQAEADAWARGKTSGLVERFPITISDWIYLLMATALAAKVSWERPFDLVNASALGPGSPWVALPGRVLSSPEHPGHRAFIAATDRAGDVAVHTGSAVGGLQVTSVIASPGVPPGDVLAAAHEIAIAEALGRAVPRRSLFDLPLGDGLLWSVTEERSQAGDQEKCTAVLPVWSARSDHDLSNPRLGFAAAAHALDRDAGDPWQARQTVTATYSRTGFEAAAVTAMAIMLSATAPRRGLLRRAELRFGHPYAVVAVVADEEAERPHGPLRPPPPPGPWHGVPVFSAWVAEPEPASRN